MLLLLLIVACGGAPTSQPVVPPATVWVDAQKVASKVHITLHAPAGAVVEGTEGLLVVPVDETSWDLSGEDGSYIVGVVQDGETTPVRLFVDIGVEGPSGGAMDGLAALPPPPPAIWPWVLGGAVLAAVMTYAALLAWKHLRPPPPPPILEPAEVIARRAWAALRARTDLGPEEVAMDMSGIFRTWIDGAWGFPAPRRTSREILDNLAGSFTALELDAARRLLMATDLVKFAERSEHADLFVKLDGDFDALVRPVRRA